MGVGLYHVHVGYGFIVKWCPFSINDARPNHMCDFIYRSCVYSCIVVIKGGSYSICLFLGREI